MYKAGSQCGAYYRWAARACLSVFGKSFEFKHGQTPLGTYASHVRSHNSTARREGVAARSHSPTHPFVSPFYHLLLSAHWDSARTRCRSSILLGKYSVRTQQSIDAHRGAR